MAGRLATLVPHGAGGVRLQAAESGRRELGGAARRWGERQSRSGPPTRLQTRRWAEGRAGDERRRGSQRRSGAARLRVLGTWSGFFGSATVREPERSNGAAVLYLTYVFSVCMHRIMLELTKYRYSFVEYIATLL